MALLPLLTIPCGFQMLFMLVKKLEEFAFAHIFGSNNNKIITTHQHIKTKLENKYKNEAGCFKFICDLFNKKHNESSFAHVYDF